MKLVYLLHKSPQISTNLHIFPHPFPWSRIPREKLVFTEQAQAIRAKQLTTPYPARSVKLTFYTSQKERYIFFQNYVTMYGMSQNNELAIEEVFARVSGFVQGVGYRQFVVQKALSFGLRGYAHNCGDGSVEVLAQGGRPALEHLLTILWQGPPASEVEAVEVSWREPTEHFRGFMIRW